MTEQTKRCARCKVSKPVSAFGLQGSYLHSYCRDCCAEVQRLYRAQHPERSREANRRSYARRRTPPPAYPRPEPPPKVAKANATNRAWKQRNRAHLREYGRAWRAANAARYLKTQCEWVSRNGLRLSDAERSARAETLVRRATDATDAYFARRAARLNREAITALKARPPLSYPYLTDTSGEGAALLTRIHAAVPRGVPESVRADACQAIVLAVLSGEISEEQVEAVAHEYVRRQYPPKRFLSLDAQLRGRYSLLEQLTSDDTLGAWVARGPYGDALADCVGVGDLAERLSDAWEANRLKGERVMTYSGFSPMRHCDSEAMVAGRKGMYIGVRRYKYVPSSAGQRARDMLAWDVEGYRARRLAEESSP